MADPDIADDGRDVLVGVGLYHPQLAPPTTPMATSSAWAWERSRRCTRGAPRPARPRRATPTWTATTRFCATTLRGGGCATGSVCLPAITNNPQRCVLAAGSASCPAGTQRSDWYTGYTGNFACNPCSCGQPSGASCADVRLFVGNNASCDLRRRCTRLLAGGEHVCAPHRHPAQPVHRVHRAAHRRPPAPRRTPPADRSRPPGRRPSAAADVRKTRAPNRARSSSDV